MAWSVFDLETDDHIAHIRFNRPDKLNSFIPQMWKELPRAVSEIDGGGEARVIVISAQGKHFTAGLDFSVFESLKVDTSIETGRERAAFMQLVKTLQESFSALKRARIPVIAAIQGGCIGAGLDLVSACDLRYASTDAFFSLQEINIGMTADVGTFPRLQKLIPAGVAREMAFTGEPLTSDRAEQTGLVNAVYDSTDELMDAVMEVAAKIAEKSPLAIWGSKEMLNYGDEHTTDDTLLHVATWQAGMFSYADVKTAFQAQQSKQLAQFERLAAKKKL